MSTLLSSCAVRPLVLAWLLLACATAQADDVEVPAEPAVATAPPTFAADADFATRLAGLSAWSTSQPQPAYPLDAISRDVPARGRLRCPEVTTVTYRGKVLSYGRSITVAAELVPALEELEHIIRDVAIATYGRAPTKIRTLGTYNCRRMRLYSTLLSEHGLANAIDVEGFEFGPLPKVGKAERDRIPVNVRGRFTVLIQRHWQGGTGARATHQHFLQELILRLIERDVFRVYLGPNYPGHQNHFHLDMSNFRMVDI